MMKNLSISPAISVKEAMEILDKTAEKVLLVVDDEKRLLGALSDGDIRRHILKGHPLKGSIEDAYNKNPSFIYQEEGDLDQINTIFKEKKISLIPVVNKDRKIVDYITLEKVFGKIKKAEKKDIDAPVVIMAGGKGTRLAPFTQVLPKPLIPVKGKTVIDHIIDRFRAHHVRTFYFTINYMSKIIRAYFEEKNADYTTGFAEEVEPLGTAGSLKLLGDKLDSPFFVSNCDIIVETDYYDIFQFHLKNAYDITLVAAAKQFNIPYGVCELNEDGDLSRIKEKPEYNFLVNTGLYVLSPNVLNMIPDNQMFHMTHLMDKVKDAGGKVGVYPISETSWIDVGQWAEFRKALELMGGNDII